MFHSPHLYVLHLNHFTSIQNGSSWKAALEFSTWRFRPRLILLLACYDPNVAKRSIWDQCKKYILRTDRRPTNDLTCGKFQIAISPRGISDPLHVWFYSGVFEIGGSNGAISGFAKSKVAAQPPSWKIQMAISPRRIIRFTPCLVLGWGFRGRAIEWRYFRFRQENSARGVIRLVTI